MAIARRLGNTHRLLLADRDALHLHGQVAAMSDRGHDVSGLVCDVSDSKAVASLAEEARRDGDSRALAHVVGPSPSMADGEAILRVTLAGAALVADAFADVLQSGAPGVFIASVAGHSPEPSPAVTAALDNPLAEHFVAAVTDGGLDGSQRGLHKAADQRCRSRS
jgi:NAD(P)-dependent dehydrogenase (short-subunit alcohol dehydrogenase family)